MADETNAVERLSLKFIFRVDGELIEVVEQERLAMVALPSAELAEAFLSVGVSAINVVASSAHNALEVAS